MEADKRMKKWMRMISLLLMMIFLFAGAALAEEEIMEMGSKGDAVLELNTRLRQLNYTLVRASDTYTNATKEAVLKVQAAYGLPETGIADAKTLEIIYGDCYRPLSTGDSGEDVKLMQEKLTELGYYWGSISGNFLDGSASAIETFQNENGLEPTGKADVKTLELLFAVTVRPTPSPSPVPTPSPTPGPYRAFKRTLSYGSTGDDVQLVQQRLMDLGFFTYHKTTTGYYKQTQEAVKQFQEKNGLKNSGSVDEKTWNALFNEPDVADANSPAREKRPMDYFIEVDVNNQVVKIWTYNEETKGYTDLDRAFLCSTGTKSNPTPLGTYTLSGKRSAHAKFPNWGGGEARWWVDLDGTNAFHSVLYGASSDDSTLKVSSLNNLGKRASHGCIRLTVADAKWMYDHVEEGIQVWVHEDAAADPELVYAIRPGKLNTEKMMPNVTPAPPVYEYDGSKAPATELRNLSVGKEGEDVFWLQMKLKELGFYTGTVTGQYREGTQKAVKAYQRARGLNADGTAGKQTLQCLYNEVAAMNVPTQTPPPVQSNTPAAPGQTPAPTVTPAPEGTKMPYQPGAITVFPTKNP